MGACILNKNEVETRIKNNDQDSNSIPGIVWILPFMMVGALFGSLAAAGLSVEMGNQTPFGPAVMGAILGMLIVGIVGWWLSQSARLH